MAKAELASKKEVFRGRGVGREAVIGRLKFARSRRQEQLLSAEERIGQLFSWASELAKAELLDKKKRAIESVGDEHGEIFEHYLNLLRDGELIEKARRIFMELYQNGEPISPKKALILASEGTEISKDFAKDGGENGKADDIKNASSLLDKKLAQMIIGCLDLAEIELEKGENCEEYSGECDAKTAQKSHYILVCEDEDSSELFRCGELLGVVCLEGAAIARRCDSLGVPAVCLPCLPPESNENMTAILDGELGRLTVSPDLEALEEFSGRVRSQDKRRERLKEQIGRKSVTRSGKELNLCASISDGLSLEQTVECDAEGIGIFDTDFLFENPARRDAELLFTSRDAHLMTENRADESRNGDFTELDEDLTRRKNGLNAWDEDSQFELYKQILKKLDGKPLVIRCFSGFYDAKFERSPSAAHTEGTRNSVIFGERCESPKSFEFSFENYKKSVYKSDSRGQSDGLKAQIRACLRASVYGSVAFLAPSIYSVEQARRISRLIAEVKSELRCERVGFGENLAFGIEIDQPAAAIMCDALAPEADFFVINIDKLSNVWIPRRYNHQDAAQVIEKCDAREAGLRFAELAAEKIMRFHLQKSYFSGTRSLNATQKSENIARSSVNATHFSHNATQLSRDAAHHYEGEKRYIQNAVQNTKDTSLPTTNATQTSSFPLGVLGVCGGCLKSASIIENFISLGATFLAIPPSHILETREKLFSIS